jgi:oligopeptide/dipeptide ABC transporter ATP-binding protein
VAIADSPLPVPLLEIQNLSLEFREGARALRAVDRVSLRLDAGETLCLVGESGSGKSLTVLSIGRLAPTPPARYAGGRIMLAGQSVLEADRKHLRELRGGIVSYVFQEPGASLNPVFRVGAQIKEMLRLHRPEAAQDAEVIRLLNSVGIPAPEVRARNYPHQLSGGMQQRAMIAMAIASRPKLLVADEPTTALDVTIQAQILELLRDLKQELGMALLLISHNLALVAAMADRVAVMYAGQIVEEGPAREVFNRPLHPYTRALLNSQPTLGAATTRLTAIPGSVPRLDRVPPGCRFHPRCDIARDECRSKMPALSAAGSGRKVRCPFADEGRES